MKAFIASLALVMSFAAAASEIKVLDIDARTAGKGSLSTKFAVFLEDDSSGVSVKISKRHGGKNPYTTTKTFTKSVPELSLKGKVLELSIDGKTVDCGTMGVTSILSRPTLKLSGKCDVVAKRVNGAVQVSIVAE